MTDLATVPTTPGKTYIVSKVSTSTPTISGGTIILSTQVYPTNTTVFQWIIVATGSTFTITNGSRTGDLGAIQLD